MVPNERREVGEQAVGHVLSLAQGGHGALEVSRVPQDDGGDEQIEARRAVLLVLIGAVADLSEAMDEHRPRQAVAGFALVQLLSRLRRSCGSLSQSSVKRVRSSRPTSRNAVATPFCRGYAASWRMITEAVTVPARTEVTIRRISDQCARIRATLMRPAIIFSNAG